MISEIHFNAPDPDGLGLRTEKEFEFFELYKSTGAEVDLSGWRVTGSVELTLEEGTTIGAG